MKWQDLVFTIGALVFVVALMPTVRGKEKPALSTSLMTGTVLFLYALTFTTLSLWFSAITTTMTSAQWFILAWQKHAQTNK